jgi:hypothetical protein
VPVGRSVECVAAAASLDLCRSVLTPTALHHGGKVLKKRYVVLRVLLDEDPGGWVLPLIPGAAEAVHPPRELNVVGEADSVAPLQHHILPHHDALGPEQPDHGTPHVGAREVALHVVHIGAIGAMAAQPDREPRPVEDHHDLPHDKHEDVSRGDHTRTGRLPWRLGVVPKASPRRERLISTTRSEGCWRRVERPT